MRERCNVIPGGGCMLTMNYHYCYCYCYDYVLSPKGTCGGDVSAWPRIVRCVALQACSCRLTCVHLLTAPLANL